MAKAKEIEGLECRAGAAQGMRLVLLTRLGEVCEHRASALDRRGEDGVHDMRVASRRRRASAFEKATVPRKLKGGEDEQCFGDLGRRIIARSWEELRERGPDIYRPLKTKRLHKLRIAAKRLRYALELFAACFGEGLKELAHELAGLQKALGELHDCDEWIKEC